LEKAFQYCDSLNGEEKFTRLTFSGSRSCSYSVYVVFYLKWLVSVDIIKQLANRGFTAVSNDAM
jgi:hypothetical protein